MAIEWVIYGLLKAALAGACAGAVISLLILCWDDICDWFQARRAMVLGNADHVGFSLQERIAGGNYKTVYGIFNTRTNQVVDAQAVASQQVDARLAEIHRGEELVVIRS